MENDEWESGAPSGIRCEKCGKKFTYRLGKHGERLINRHRHRPKKARIGSNSSLASYFSPDARTRRDFRNSGCL